MTIRIWPDSILDQIAEPVPVGERCRELVDAMMKTLESSANGVGLAAPQIGVSKRVIVCRVPIKHFGGVHIVKHVIINPELIWWKGQMVEGWEGCLSFPDKQVLIPRYMRIQVRGYNLQWEPITVGAKGLVARVLQHEIDHLNGRHLAYYARMAHEIEEAKKAASEQLSLSFEGGHGPPVVNVDNEVAS